ncbi:hypothetical protein LJB71_03685 [Thermomonas sp. S9]|uniref:cytochrome oxidase putative small subunit CydP n=1 Tax=Thermomonas sp. S9 TaxID=2885203 RepID=UPI00216B5AEF|nr:cytochrome oxidase putative small subunit CydP [Thermomonas sp. S9]MCR6495424.1 hypothetical protein [Thermomonas sp. S9]
MATDHSRAPGLASPWAWLRRHLLLLIAIKLCLLSLLFMLFFGPGQRPTVDADAVARQLQSPSVPSSSR